MKPKEIEQHISKVLERDDLPSEVRDELTSTVSRLRTPLQTDVWIYRIVVVILGLIVLSTVVGGIYISVIAMGDATIQLSEGIIAIGSAAVGALAGLLAPGARKD